MRRGFVPILIVLAVLASFAVSGWAYYSLTKKSPVKSQNNNIALQSPSANSNPSTTPASSTHLSTTSPQSSPDLGYSLDNKNQGWKVYKNSKYNFSFEYPSDWILEANDSTGGTSPFLDIHLRNKESTNDYKCPTGFAGVEIQVGNSKNSDKNFDTFVKNSVLPQGAGMSPSGKIDKFTINGKIAYKVEHSGGEGLCPVGPGYFIEQDQTHYTYIFTGADEQNGLLVESGTITQIVNSINFL